MAITKDKPKTTATPMAKAIELMKSYRELKLQAASANEQAKTIEGQLFDIAEGHPEWFEKSKTLALDVYGKVAYVSKTVVILDSEKYNADAFQASFPECVDLELKVSAIKGVTQNETIRDAIANFGVKLGTKETFTVTPNK